MVRRTLDDWLTWQESLNTEEIDLGLDRVRDVAARLNLQQPDNGVFLIAGTNGKGSVVAALSKLLAGAGKRSGSYTSPHLIRYNERVCINGEPVSDEQLIAGFEAVEAVRGDIPLTYFEFGTLAAFVVLSEAQLDAWVIEVGLGGRLDATNVIEPDVSLITTIALDHQSFLGDTIDAIAREKAGIMRAGKPALFGDPEMPAAIAEEAERYGAQLLRQGLDFGFTIDDDYWVFDVTALKLDELPLPPGDSGPQLQNQSLALAAINIIRPEWLSDTAAVRAALQDCSPAGRFYIADTEKPAHQWVLDVGHNPQALQAFYNNLSSLESRPTTLVLGMLADKDAILLGRLFGDAADVCITTDVVAPRGQTGQQLAQKLADSGLEVDEVIADNHDAMARAAELTPDGGRIVVCGSFFVVGPALEWLTIEL